MTQTTLASLVLALGAALAATPAVAQDTKTVPGDADAGSSYLLRQSTLWYDRWLSGLFTHATVNLDIDRDGDIDVFVAPGNGQDQRLPVRIMVNQGDGTFVDGTASKISNAQPGLIHARKALVGDYNHDGWPDVFVAGHGYDQPPFPGEYPQLFLSNGDGTLHYDVQLQALVGFDHAAASGDVDRNGSLDIVVVQQGAPYVLLNDGLGQFTKSTAMLPAEVAGKNYYSGELIDVDRDGWLDLLLGGHEFEGAATVVYWGGPGGWSASRKFVFPVVANQGIVLDFAAEDIDGDGLRDLVADRSGQSPFYTGRGFQILRQVGWRQFADETGARIALDATQGWIDYFRLQDVDGDGDPDLFTDDKHRTFDGAYAWINDGHGVFTAANATIQPAPALSLEGGSVAEGDAGQKSVIFTLRSTQPVIQPVQVGAVTQAGTATAGADYLDYAGTLQLQPGQSVATATVTVLGDTEVEPDETVALELRQPSGATLRRSLAAARIVNDDLAQLSIGDVAVAEGAAGMTTLTFPVTLSRPMPTPVRFDVASSDGTAASDGAPGIADYYPKVQVDRLIDAGRTQAVFTMTVAGDVTPEPDETFVVTLSNLRGASAGDLVATGTIVNDDGAASATIAATRAPARAVPVAAPAVVAPAARECATLAARIGVLEGEVAAGRLGEKTGIARILALERHAAKAGCAVR